MMPVRRKRFLATFCAVVIVVLLYRVYQNSWVDSSYAGLRNVYENPLPQDGESGDPVQGSHAGTSGEGYESTQQKLAEQAVEDAVAGQDAKGMKYDGSYEEEDLGVKVPPALDTQSSESKLDPITGEDLEGGHLGSHGSTDSDESLGSSYGKDSGSKAVGDSSKALDSAYSDDDRTEPPTGTVPDADPSKTEGDGEVKWKNPPNTADEDEGEETADRWTAKKKKVHWEKQIEHFPLPSESITPLPSGAPKKVPKIQAKFEEESENQRIFRMQRQQRVKDEIARSWGAYATHAWMHDELLPVTGKSRDPFCGWAATMVDSLDTLWIAGLKDEFNDAVKGVAEIDFTYTHRNDIPVFETTIRYLGGLLAAYDVSGGPDGEHKILLDKAVELAEVLFGIFDTPNRMPLLYYQWKPEQASQPHRAGKVGIAELATLSMEFTRLAQLTGEDKYYDAINRITDGLVQMQEDGTNIPGLFPEGIDVSGCNKTATTIRDDLSKAAQQQLDAETSYGEPKGYVPASGKGSSEYSGQELVKDDDRTMKRDGGLEKRIVLDEVEDRVLTESEMKRSRPPFSASGNEADWDCVPQGLAPSGYGYQSFHMGGGQDSAYEYFPKQWLLLGGLESKYQKLYEDAVDGINNWLLFKPMSDDDWETLFTAKVSTNSRENDDLQPQFEITHLTCFIGGMYALGGKIFERELDVELAKQLTDGCVWAYQSFPSGLMPESSRVVPCPTLEKCDFNETFWWDVLDTSRAYREKETARWLKEEEELNRGAQPDTYVSEKDAEAEKLEQTAQDYHDDESDYRARNSPLDKRGVIPVVDEKVLDEADSELPDSLKKKLGIEEEDKTSATAEDDATPPSLPETASEEERNMPVHANTIPKYAAPERMTPNRKKPLSHEEYVQHRIKFEHLPPGFTDIASSNYILR